MTTQTTIQVVASLQVIAVDVPFSQTMVAAEVGYKRSYKVTILPSGQVQQVVFTAADTSLLTVSKDGSTYDTATLHEAAGTAIAGGATGVNLCDVHVLART